MQGYCFKRSFAVIIAILIFIATPNAKAQCWDNVEIFPAEPTDTSTISITVSGEWGNSCIPQQSDFYIDGNNIYFDVFLEPQGICAQVMTSWELTEDVGQLPEGTYTVYAGCHQLPDPTLPYEYTQVATITVTRTINYIMVDDDAPNDPAPGDTTISDPLEDGSELHPFDAIQEAVDVAQNGDVISVLQGTYTGLGNHDIVLYEKEISITGVGGPEGCIVDCQNLGSAFWFMQTPTSGCHLSNLTVKNGYSDIIGGAVYCLNSTPTISNCIFFLNTTDDIGGAVGYYIFCSGEITATIKNCTFYGNYAALNGSAVAMRGHSGSAVDIENSIIWGNPPIESPAMAVDPAAKCGIPYIAADFNILQSDWGGQGNFTDDPIFADADNEDFHQKSQGGRWDPVAQDWVLDDITSPAVDAGNPDDGIALEPIPHGMRINLGAFGGTAQASKTDHCYTGPDYEEWIGVEMPESWCNPYQCHGDADGYSMGKSEIRVSAADLNYLLCGWQVPFTTGLSSDLLAADFDHKGFGKQNIRVSANDLNILLAYWQVYGFQVPADCLTANPVSP